MTPAEYEKVFGHLGGAEQDPHLEPDGFVVRRRYEPEVERFGTGSALQACESHFEESTTIALAVLAEEPNGAVRDSLGALVVADLVRAMPARQRREWREQVAASSGPVRKIDPMLVESGLAHPVAPVRQFRASLKTLADTLSADTGDYVAPTIGFGGIRLLDPGDSGPTATLDIAAHLFCNRLGITVPTELALRRGIAVALEGTAGPV